MSDLTNLEINRLCAEAMGLAVKFIAGKPVVTIDGFHRWYDPLHDDAQAMVLEDWLITRGYLHYEDGNNLFYTWPLETSANKFSADFSDAAGRRRAICMCVVDVTQTSPVLQGIAS